MLDFSKAVSGFSQHARCIRCKRSFRPHPRLKNRQKTCGLDACRRKHRACYQRRYRQDNPDVEKESRQKIKEGRPVNFWKTYRRTHLKSSERNRNLTKLRMRLKRSGLQRKLDIVQVIDPPGYFDQFCKFATSHRSLLDELKVTPQLRDKGA